MKGRKPFEYKLEENDRHFLQEIATDGRVVQRIAIRARALLALDRGERICEIVRWTGLTRMALWYLWQRYTRRGVKAIFDAERSGRPSVPASGSRREQLDHPADTELPVFDLE
jgi:hypothetical protein